MQKLLRMVFVVSFNYTVSRRPPQLGLVSNIVHGDRGQLFNVVGASRSRPQ